MLYGRERMDIHLISEARYQNLLAIIAHQNHTTPERVEAALDAALQSAWAHSGSLPQSRRPPPFDRFERRPTVREFISVLAERMT